ncbi:MAG: DUF2905 domain-containing protein [Burkholderiaceae bacterium]|nr:DUF2905 domain-containing protein [Burkholderiaceae bacterium]
MKWLIAVALALFIFSGLTPWLRRIGFGRLPGDFRFRLRGRDFDVPLASTVLLSLAVGLLARLL